MDKRDKWIAWNKVLKESEVRERYFAMVGREPDRIYSPEESKTNWWWTGWVSESEYGNTNKYMDKIRRGEKMKNKKNYVMDCENCRFGVKENEIQWFWGYCEAKDMDTIIDYSYLPVCDGTMFQPKEEEIGRQEENQ